MCDTYTHTHTHTHTQLVIISHTRTLKKQLCARARVCVCVCVCVCVPLQVKDREIERLTRALDAARATEHELTSAHLSCQEAMRQLDEQLVTHRQRVTSLESQVKAREQDIDRLNKQVGVCACVCVCRVCAQTAHVHAQVHAD